MAIPLPKQSLNEHIDVLCGEYPEFKAFNSKFKGKYDIISINEAQDYSKIQFESHVFVGRGVLNITISIEFTSGRMKGMVADLKIKKIQKQ